MAVSYTIFNLYFLYNSLLLLFFFNFDKQTDYLLFYKNELFDVVFEEYETRNNKIFGKTV